MFRFTNAAQQIQIQIIGCDAGRTRWADYMFDFGQISASISIQQID